MNRLLLLLVVSFVSAASGADRYTEFLGPQVKLIEELADLSKKADYAGIYARLGRQYRGVVDEGYFVRESKKLSWRIVKVDYGTVDIRQHFAWMPVRGTIQLSGSREVRFDSVVFFAEENRQWKLVMFPFLRAPLLPEEGEIPGWVLKAAEEYAK